jgi:hypothetical protein
MKRFTLALGAPSRSRWVGTRQGYRLFRTFGRSWTPATKSLLRLVRHFRVINVEGNESGTGRSPF